jgi:putative transcriptional regulator
MNKNTAEALGGKTVGQLMAEGFEELASVAKADKRRIPAKFNCHKVVLDLEPTPYSPELVKSTRHILSASQPVFAKFLGVSPQTVRAWEQGVNHPSESAGRLMDEIRHDPAYWQARIQELMVVKNTRKSAKPSMA